MIRHRKQSPEAFPRLFLEKSWVPLGEGRLSPLNTALLFGESLMETVPVYGGKPLFFREHLDRLEKGCRFLGWTALPRRRFEEAVRICAASLPGPFAVRFCLAQEMDPPLPKRFSPKPPRLLALARPLRHHPGHFWPPLGRAGVSPWRVPGPLSVPGSFKWPFHMTVRRDFRSHPDWDEMLRLDRDGFVADGGFAAPLWFFKGTVHACPREQGGLESVTAGRVLDLCRSLGIRVSLRKWRPEEALKGGELFFAGTGVGLLGITRLQGRTLERPRLVLRLWQHYRRWTLEKASF